MQLCVGTDARLTVVVCCDASAALVVRGAIQVSDSRCLSVFLSSWFCTTGVGEGGEVCLRSSTWTRRRRIVPRYRIDDRRHSVATGLLTPTDVCPRCPRVCNAFTSPISMDGIVNVVHVELGVVPRVSDARGADCEVVGRLTDRKCDHDGAVGRVRETCRRSDSGQSWRRSMLSPIFRFLCDDQMIGCRCWVCDTVTIGR